MDPKCWAQSDPNLTSSEEQGKPSFPQTLKIGTVCRTDPAVQSGRAPKYQVHAKNTAIGQRDTCQETKQGLLSQNAMFGQTSRMQVKPRACDPQIFFN